MLIQSYVDIVIALTRYITEFVVMQETLDMSVVRETV